MNCFPSFHSSCPLRASAQPFSLLLPSLLAHDTISLRHAFTFLPPFLLPQRHFPSLRQRCVDARKKSVNLLFICLCSCIIRVTNVRCVSGIHEISNTSCCSSLPQTRRLLSSYLGRRSHKPSTPLLLRRCNDVYATVSTGNVTAPLTRQLPIAW